MTRWRGYDYNNLQNMKNRKCIIIHGCPSSKEKGIDPETRTYDKHWIPWTKKELEARNIKTETPLMPSPWEPVYEEFKKVFEKYTVDENTILVGHSCGCAFLIRWLSETKRNIFKLILVAPWMVGEDTDKFRKAFYIFPIDISIKDRIKKIIMFTANNEAGGGKNGLKIFHQALGGEIISLESYGHYCLKNMGTEKFPKLIETIIK
jgi:predicted alpha/beta hydrolase family esterase